MMGPKHLASTKAILRLRHQLAELVQIEVTPDQLASWLWHRSDTLADLINTLHLTLHHRPTFWTFAEEAWTEFCDDD